MNFVLLSSSFLLLTACGQKSTDASSTAEIGSQAAVQPMAGPNDAMAGKDGTMAMNMGQMPVMASGTGTITAIDPEGHRITIKHGPIPAANWPAMTMAFKTDPKVVSTAKVGEEIAFDLKLEANDAEVTAIRKP